MKLILFLSLLTTAPPVVSASFFFCAGAPRCWWFGLGVRMNQDCTVEICTLFPFLYSAAGYECDVCPDQSAMTRSGSYELLETVPHDGGAFTQGLLTATDETDGSLYFYEGTGQNGSSELRRVEIQTGNVMEQYKLPNNYFGEGIALYPKVDNGADLEVLQLTWTSRTGFRYNHNALLDDVQPSTFTFSTTRNEGWGVTYNPSLHVLYVSDGSSNIHVWNANTRQEIDRFQVAYRNSFDVLTPLSNLNELEYDPATDTILANVWLTNNIARIDPATGFVTVLYNMSGLSSSNLFADVLNGIALTYDGLKETVDTREYWVTGKLWSNMHRVRLID